MKFITESDVYAQVYTAIERLTLAEAAELLNKDLTDVVSLRSFAALEAEMMRKLEITQIEDTEGIRFYQEENDTHDAFWNHFDEEII